MNNIDRLKPWKLFVKGQSWKTGVTFSANLAPEETVTSTTFHPWDSRWARHVLKWAQNVILGFKITIFSIFYRIYAQETAEKCTAFHAF